ncbi:MAG: cell division protein ZapA [Elusimicrobiales bacterium]
MPKVGVTINRIQLDSVSVDGLEELEVGIVAKEVEDRIARIEADTGHVDTVKLALLAAMSFAAELYQLRQETESKSRLGEKDLDKVIDQLQSTLSR